MLIIRKSSTLIVLLGMASGVVCSFCSNTLKSNKSRIANMEKNVGACLEQTKKAQVICRGLQWLLDHPADIADPQGILEMGGELHIFYQFYVRSNNPQEKDFFKNIITSKIKCLLNKNDFQVKFGGEITAYIIFAKIMKKLGMNSSRYQHFIEQEIVNNDKTYPLNININVTIFVSGLIDGIAYAPKYPFKDILYRGVIYQYSHYPHLILQEKSLASPRYMMEFYYLIAHEIFAMANFGDRNPFEFLGEREFRFLKSVIPLGISTSIAWGEIDILSELIICARLLRYTDFEGFEKGVQFILDTQKEDGSFGSSIRAADLGCTNLYRHAVVMALWALLE